MGKLVNEEIAVKVPKGTRKLKILDIKVM